MQGFRGEPSAFAYLSVRPWIDTRCLRSRCARRRATAGSFAAWLRLAGQAAPWHLDLSSLSLVGSVYATATVILLELAHGVDVLVDLLLNPAVIDAEKLEDERIQIAREPSNPVLVEVGEHVRV